MDSNANKSHFQKIIRRFLIEYAGYQEIREFNPINNKLTIFSDPLLMPGEETAPINPLGNWLDFHLLESEDSSGIFHIQNNDNITDKLATLEFAGWGGIDEMRLIISDFLYYLGLEAPKLLLYEDMCARYECVRLEPVHDLLMQQEFGNILWLEMIPERANPPWNARAQLCDKKYRLGSMVLQRDTIKKKDIESDPELYCQGMLLLYGKPTFIGWERMNSKELLRQRFFHYYGGRFAEWLCQKSGENEIHRQLERYFTLASYPYFGGILYYHALIRALRFANLWQKDEYSRQETQLAYYLES